MASPQAREKDGGGVGGVEDGGSKEAGVGSTGPEQAVDAGDSRRIGPWHTPDPRRQRILADRLSNPALRAARPATSSPHSSRRSCPSPLLSHSPYHPSGRMDRASSGPPSSPRRNTTSTSSPHTPHYGAVSPRRQPPLYCTPGSSRRVTEEELDGIVERVTKPTVASRGGVDLQDKDFTYITTPRLKTLPVLPGLDRRYLGLQRVDSARMEQIVQRLTRLTSAYKSKFAPNNNVYVDMEPGAHMVPRRTQSAV
ncbi:uncharacterized protein LOC143289708 [Babylonia areolata]|uniref:uncharacterized protein LOC143289708 n=1 Tax=Babylonia areolata TaxID=304850 RepID=UPI003FD4D137